MPELPRALRCLERPADFLSFRLRLVRMAFRPLHRLPGLVVMALEAPEYEISFVATGHEQAEAPGPDADAAIYGCADGGRVGSSRMRRARLR